MSRSTLAVQKDARDLSEIVEAHSQYEGIKIKFYLKEFPLFNKNSTILCHIQSPWPFISKYLCQSIFDSLHSLVHSGIGSSTKVIQ